MQLKKGDGLKMTARSHEEKHMQLGFGKSIFFVLFMMIVVNAGFSQSTRVGENVVLRPQRTETPPVLDGVLDDAAWKNDPIITGPFIVNQPVYGEQLPQKTHIWLTYDSKNIYVAYYCFDDRPENIRGTMTRRDAILSEDWIDMDIDTFGNRQMTYEHACNPLGVQADLINSVSGGESANPDWVWYSAGKIVSDGYIVEVRIPLKSLRYRGGKSVTMNIGFYRNVSHSGTNASWPQQNQQLGYFNSLVPVIFEDLASQLRLEALPAVTFSSIRDRQSPPAWAPADKDWQAGLDLKYGVTPTSNLELTVNPDYSQVETDQFQVQVNQRYPNFFSEKRPFFMEVANLFSLAAANGNGNMVSAVHTRTIIDPAWGAKFTGEFSRFSLGLLAAGDEWPGREGNAEAGADPGENANSMIARGKFLLGGDNYVGVLYSGREFGEEYNRVIAADSHFRLKGKHSFSVNGIYSFSGNGEGDTRQDGGAMTINYDYNQRPLDMNVIYEDYGQNFRMDSSFYNRTGFSSISAYLAPHFYPKWPGLPWLQRINFVAQGTYLGDKATGGKDSFLSSGISINTMRQGLASLQLSRTDEFWAEQNFAQNRISFNASLQPKTWLNTRFNLSYGGALNYQQAFLGNSINFFLGVVLQLGSQLRQEFNYTYQDFHRADDRSHVYDLNIVVSRSTFQFNKHLFVRSLIQYDSFRKRVLTDLLASFTLIPGTVMHVGYGLLHEKKGYENNAWRSGLLDAEYFNLRQSFFFKVSYRWQF